MAHMGTESWDAGLVIIWMMLIILTAFRLRSVLQRLDRHAAANFLIMTT